MRRMISELRFIYSKQRGMELLKSMILAEIVISLISVFAYIKGNNYLIHDIWTLCIMIFLIPLTICVGLPLQWFLDIKPVTDRLYKEQELQSKWNFYYDRFTKLK